MKTFISFLFHLKSMIQEIPAKQLMEFWPFFKSHKLNNLLAQNLTWSKVKGFVDDLKYPDVIMYLCDQWACYLAGNYNSNILNDFLVKIPEKAFIYVPSQEWESRLKNYWTFFGYFSRIELSAEHITLEAIRKLIKPLPAEFQLKRIDASLAKQLLTQNFSEYWVEVINYLGGPERFVTEGIGFCITEDKKICSLIMGYKASFPLTGSVELDIVTHPDYRGRGFAMIVSAKLIEHLLSNGIKPHWDAANPISAKIAQKLGFSKPEPYKCYYWRKSPWTISELNKSFNTQFEKGLKDVTSLKLEISSVSANELIKKRVTIRSQLDKIQGVFEGITLTLNRLLESNIVEKSDIPQFNDFKKRILQQINILNQLRLKINR